MSTPTCVQCNKRDPLRKSGLDHYCEYLSIFVPDDESSEGCDGFFAGKFCSEPPVCPDCDGTGELDTDTWCEYDGHNSVGRRCPTCNGGKDDDREIEDE